MELEFSMRYSGSGKEFTMTRRRKPQKTFVKALIMVHSDWRGDDVAALDYLEERGLRFGENFSIHINHRQPLSRKDITAVGYLQDEWDYGPLYLV